MSGRGRGRGAGYSSRGRGKKLRGGRGGRHIATAEEVEARNAELSRPAAAAAGYSSSEDEEPVASGRAATAGDVKKTAAREAAAGGAEAPPRGGSSSSNSSAHSSNSSEESGDEDTQIKFKRPLDFLRHQKKKGEETSEDEDDLCNNMGGLKVSQPQLTRREREAIEQQRRQRHYEKLHAEGKTPEAKADLARLAEVRQRREEAARLRAQGGG